MKVTNPCYPGAGGELGEWWHPPCPPVLEEARGPTRRPQTEAFAPTSLGAQLLYRLGIWESFPHFPVLPSPGADFPEDACLYRLCEDLAVIPTALVGPFLVLLGGLRDCQSLAFQPFHSLVSHEHCSVASRFSTQPFGLRDSRDGKLWV